MNSVISRTIKLRSPLGLRKDQGGNYSFNLLLRFKPALLVKIPCKKQLAEFIIKVDWWVHPYE